MEGIFSEQSRRKPMKNLRLGLSMISKLANLWQEKKRNFHLLVPALNRSFVSVYKFVGFLLLASIVVAMVFYLGCSGFYIFNHHWIVPSILTPQNERVMTAHTTYLERLYQLESMKAEMIQLEKEEEHVHFVIQLQEQFQTSFTKGLQNEKLRYDENVANYKTVFDSIEKDQILLSEKQNLKKIGTIHELKDQLNSGVITEEEFFRTQQQILQSAMGDLERQEKWIELQKQQKSLSSSLNTFRENPLQKKSNAILSFLDEKNDMNVSILLKQKPLFDSLVAASEFGVRLSPLEKKKEALAKIITDFSSVVETLKNSPLVRASTEAVMLAFVPYENLENIIETSPIYGCYLEFFLCQKVGTIDKILPGEVTAKHPLSGRDLRGQWVELKMEAFNSWAQKHSLIANYPPFLL